MGGDTVSDKESDKEQLVLGSRQTMRHCWGEQWMGSGWTQCNHHLIKIMVPSAIITL
jgi:hypothetical protein